MDADTVVMNPKISLDNFLPPEEYNHIHLLMTNDGHGLNNGVFFIKVHPWSVELISTVIAYPIYRPDVELEYRDQSALDNILKEKHFNKNYLLLPQRWINAYQYDFGDDNKRPWQINPGDLLVHFPGVPEGDKRMRLYADRAERHLPEWELDFQNTTYPQEIKEYWTEQHEKLAEQRDMAERAAQAAELFIKETDDQLSIHRDRMASEEIKRVEDEMKALKKSLGLNRDIEDATKTASKNLEEVRGHSLPRHRPLLTDQ